MAVAVAVLLLLGAAVGAVSGALRPAAGVARADVAIDLVEAGVDEQRDARALQTQTDVVESRGVLGPVASGLGVPVEELQRTVSAELLPESTIIRIEARAGTGEEAQRVVAGVVTRYLQVAFAAEAPRAELVRARLLGPPYPAREDAGHGVVPGAVAGLLVAAVVAGVAALVQGLRWRRG
ncbi:MAG TPA: hypothetical protein VD813_09720 [Pseudonocardia sp.]|nr:hypothetical protein [Pseudonocardia sp.]